MAIENMERISTCLRYEFVPPFIAELKIVTAKGKTMSTCNASSMILLLTAGVAMTVGGTASALTVDSPEIGDSVGFSISPTTPGKWGNPTFGTGASVTYSFMPSGLDVDGTLAGDTEPASSSTALDEFMPAGYKAEIVAAFDAWQAIANITFTEVPDPGVGWREPGAEASDIRIAGHSFDGPGGVLAHAFFPPENAGAPAGDLHFDPAENWKIGFGGPGFDIFQVAAHEIGHSIGLAHICSDVTVASCETALLNPLYTEAFRGLQADDIAGARAIYGTASTAPPPVIPLPASLPLLGSVLVLLGGLGLRRKRRGAVASVA